jgi:hypothetical protein
MPGQQTKVRVCQVVGQPREWVAATPWVPTP